MKFNPIRLQRLVNVFYLEKNNSKDRFSYHDEHPPQTYYRLILCLFQSFCLHLDNQTPQHLDNQTRRILATTWLCQDSFLTSMARINHRQTFFILGIPVHLYLFIYCLRRCSWNLSLCLLFIHLRPHSIA